MVPDLKRFFRKVKNIFDLGFNINNYIKNYFFYKVCFLTKKRLIFFQKIVIRRSKGKINFLSGFIKA